MRKLVFLTLLVAGATSQAGCSSCGSCRPKLFGLFHRGDECCVDSGCMGGVEGGWTPRSTGLSPVGTDVMPAPLEVQPIN